MEIIRYDCRYFRADIPCLPHKRDGVHCSTCIYYAPVKERILIIKLDAPGDVLRTTCILPGLREKYPAAQITWITKSESISIFYGNPYVDRVIELNQAIYVLETDDFDLVINLDTAPLSSRLASIAKGKDKKGFGYDPKGFVYPLNAEAEPWFALGLFDDYKKANTQTYQAIMLDICGLTPADYSIQYFIKPEEKGFANKFAQQHGLQEGRLIIGLNTGAGKRWEKKKWTLNGYCELIELLKKEYPNIAILLYGGPEEAERNKQIAAGSKGAVIDTGCNNSLREFASLLNLSSLIVTGDTMALHLAVALKKKIVALIGPTSSTELDLYGRGYKVTADMTCLCCYKTTCDNKPSCMEQIKPYKIIEVIKNLLSNSEWR